MDVLLPSRAWRNLGLRSSTAEPAPPSLPFRALLLAADMERKARQIDADFADKTDLLTLHAGVKSEEANALYVAADLVRQAWGKIKDMEP